MSKYHQILGVSSNATKAEIRSAYLKLVKKHHPDNGGNSDKFIEIQEAYNVLYNDKPPKEEERGSGSGGFGGFGGFDGGFDFSNLFSNFFTGNGQQYYQQTYDYDKNVSLGIRFEDLNQNKDLRFSYEYFTKDNSTKGYKKVREDIQIDRSKISISKMLKQSYKMRFNKKGSLSSNLKHQGDLIVHLVFEATNASSFWVSNHQLHSNLNITAKEFTNGGSITTTLLGKEISIKIPILNNSSKTIKPSFTFNDESYSIVFSVCIHNTPSINSKDRISNKF